MLGVSKRNELRGVVVVVASDRNLFYNVTRGYQKFTAATGIPKTGMKVYGQLVGRRPPKKDFSLA